MKKEFLFLFSLSVCVNAQFISDCYLFTLHDRGMASLNYSADSTFYALSLPYILSNGETFTVGYEASLAEPGEGRYHYPANIIISRRRPFSLTAFFLGSHYGGREFLTNRTASEFTTVYHTAKRAEDTLSSIRIHHYNHLSFPFGIVHFSGPRDGRTRVVSAGGFAGTKRGFTYEEDLVRQSFENEPPFYLHSLRYDRFGKSFQYGLNISAALLKHHEATDRYHFFGASLSGYRDRFMPERIDNVSHIIDIDHYPRIGSVYHIRASDMRTYNLSLRAGYAELPGDMEPYRNILRFRGIGPALKLERIALEGNANVKADRTANYYKWDQTWALSEERVGIAAFSYLWDASLRLHIFRHLYFRFSADLTGYIEADPVMVMWDTDASAQFGAGVIYQMAERYLLNISLVPLRSFYRVSEGYDTNYSPGSWSFSLELSMN